MVWPMAVSNDIGQNVGVVANRKQCLGWLAIGWISAVIFTATAIG